ncbi:hypothetical protein IE077_003385, partial [Cardiosporidium cionae]
RGSRLDIRMLFESLLLAVKHTMSSPSHEDKIYSKRNLVDSSMILAPSLPSPLLKEGGYPPPTFLSYLHGNAIYMLQSSSGGILNTVVSILSSIWLFIAFHRHIDFVRIDQGSPTHPEETIYIRESHGRFLFATSFILLLPCIMAFVWTLYDLGVVSAMVMGSSFVHWYKPRFGYRRLIDVCIVSLSILYHLIAALFRTTLFFTLLWMSMAVLSILCYSFGRWMSLRGYFLMGTLFHAFIHFMGSLTNLILYYSIYKLK